MVIGTEGAYPPFNTINAAGELEGFDIDIANALCEEMEVECTFVTQAWDGMIPALQNGNFDALIASMSITPARQEQVDFTDPYYANSLVFVAPEDTGLTGTSPEDLADATIGVQSGTIAARFMEENYPDVEVRPYPTQIEAYTDLITGRTDAVLGDFGVQDAFLKSEDGEGFAYFGDAVYDDDVIGIALRKEDDDLREMFNEALAAIQENGTYDEIRKKYFDFDISAD